MIQLFEVALKALGLPPISELPLVKSVDLADKQKTFFEFKKYIELYEKGLKEIMFDVAERDGTRDENGSYTFVNDEGIGWKKEARIKMSIDKDVAKSLAELRGVDIIQNKYKADDYIIQGYLEELYSSGDEGVEVEEVVNEGALEEAVLNGRITEEEFQSMIKRDVSYARKKVGW